mmetsp:Transcript_25128/g.82419  ORF Transcript_25128/g.82419 Transcript_25128/m.82419 type:complete len:342 (-) Transcript_25128:1950-2975(-)
MFVSRVRGEGEGGWWGWLVVFDGRGGCGGGGGGACGGDDELDGLVRGGVLHHDDAGVDALERLVPPGGVKVDKLFLRRNDARGVLELLARGLGRFGWLLLRLLVRGARRRCRRLLRGALVRLHRIAARRLVLLRLVLLRLGLGFFGFGGGAQHRRRRLGRLLGRARAHRRRNRKRARFGRGRHLERWHLEIVVEGDESGGREGERDEETERVPEPVLGKHHHPHHCAHAVVPRPRSQPDGDVAPAGIDDAARHDGAHLAHRVLVLVAAKLVELLPERGNLRLWLLHEHERHGDESALAHKVDGVRDERLEQAHRLFEPSCRAGDADRHRRPVPHVRVVRLG